MYRSYFLNNVLLLSLPGVGNAIFRSFLFLYFLNKKKLPNANAIPQIIPIEVPIAMPIVLLDGGGVGTAVDEGEVVDDSKGTKDVVQTYSSLLLISSNNISLSTPRVYPKPYI